VDNVEDDVRQIPLSELSPGTSAVISRLHEEDSLVSRRLADLGFLPGTAISALHRAPMGDPMSYQLRGAKVCLRAVDADNILITDPASN